MSPVCAQIKAKPYPSERSAVEQEKMKNQLEVLSTKLNEISNFKKGPVVAFRATSVKDSGYSSEQYVNRAGTFVDFRSSQIE